MNWETYLALGDSITIGARTYQGYPEFAGRNLQTSLDKYWNVINHAQCGFTAIDLVRYVDLHFSTLLKHQASITTIMIGTNDVKKNTSVHDFEIALNQLILKAKLLTPSSKVVVLNIPQFPKGVMYPYTFEMNTKIAEFNQSIERISKEHQIQNLGVKLEHNDLYDGVHLNQIGVEKVASHISDFVLLERGIS
jgi:lysophospholipase L1-like esterase